MKFFYTLLFMVSLFACTLCAQSAGHIAYLPANLAGQQASSKFFQQDNPQNIFNGPISIHPNPATDHFNIKTDEKIGTVQLISLLGKAVRLYEANQGNRFELQGIAPGIYFVKIDHIDGIKSRTLRIKIH
jgi:hypothetical protein